MLMLQIRAKILGKICTSMNKLLGTRSIEGLRNEKVGLNEDREKTAIEVVDKANYLRLIRVIYYGSSSQVSIFLLPNPLSFFPFLPPEEDSRMAENREIGLFLILLTEVVILGSAWLL